MSPDTCAPRIFCENEAKIPLSENRSARSLLVSGGSLVSSASFRKCSTSERPTMMAARSFWPFDFVENLTKCNQACSDEPSKTLS